MSGIKISQRPSEIVRRDRVSDIIPHGYEPDRIDITRETYYYPDGALAGKIEKASVHLKKSSEMMEVGWR